MPEFSCTALPLDYTALHLVLMLSKCWNGQLCPWNLFSGADFSGMSPWSNQYSNKFIAWDICKLRMTGETPEERSDKRKPGRPYSSINQHQSESISINQLKSASNSIISINHHPSASINTNHHQTALICFQLSKRKKYLKIYIKASMLQISKSGCYYPFGPLVAHYSTTSACRT